MFVFKQISLPVSPIRTIIPGFQFHSGPRTNTLPLVYTRTRSQSLKNYTCSIERPEIRPRCLCSELDMNASTLRLHVYPGIMGLKFLFLFTKHTFFPHFVDIQHTTFYRSCYLVLFFNLSFCVFICVSVCMLHTCVEPEDNRWCLRQGLLFAPASVL